MEDSNHRSGSFIGSNDDLLIEILVRLPTTSILRFKSVSKHWRSLLTHKHFIDRYDDSKLLKSPGLFAHMHFIGHCHTVPKSIYVAFDVEDPVEDPSAAPFPSLDFYFNRSNVIIEHSCNGLLLCSAFHNGAYEYYVFNLTTKQLAFIPLPPVPGWWSVDDTILSMALAFHPRDCVNYKVVCVCDLDGSRRLIQIQVYSSDTGKWKTCVESFSSQKTEFRHHQVYWNGAVHWAPDYGSNNILYYKLNAEQLQKLPMPEGLVTHKASTLYLGESIGHLHLISLTGLNEDTLSLKVYEMLSDHSGWVVKYQLQLDVLLGDFPEVVRQYQAQEDFRNMIFGNKCVFRVVDMVRGKVEEDTFLVLLTPRKLLRYNVHDKSFKELYSNKDHYEFACEDTNVHRYIQTVSSF